MPKNKSIYIATLNQGSIRVELSDLLDGLEDQRKYNLIKTYPCKKPITQNRNATVKRFLETDCDYLLMIDEDCVPTDKILDMADYDKDIMGAVCFGYLKQMVIPFIMKNNKSGNGRYDILDSGVGNGVVECDAVGSGVIMIARRVLEDMPFPFRNEYDPEGIKSKGLDFNFCERAKKNGFKIFCDTDMLVDHWTIMNLRDIWNTYNELRKQIKK